MNNFPGAIKNKSLQDLIPAGSNAVLRIYFTSINSVSNIRVAFAGITGG
jgi:hypothetical protein